MTRLNLYKTIGFLILITCMMASPSVAQKRRKSSEQEPPSTRLRESEVYFTEGEKYFMLEDYAKALLFYQKALEINPDNASIHYKIAEVLSRNNNHEDLLKAAVSIESALKLEKQNKYFYLLAANIYTSLAKFDKAAQVYETLVDEVKGSEEYLFDLATVYQYADKPEEAIKTYNRAESILGVTETSSLQKLRIYFEMGKMKEGIAEGEKLLATFPGEERYAMGFAEVLTQKGQQSLAIISLEKFIKENEDAGNVKMLLAGLYRDTNQEEKARQLLLETFDDPSVELTSKIIILGAYNTELNQHKEDSSKAAYAFKLFQKLNQTYPNEANVHITGGDLYLSIGKNKEAVTEYLKAIELDEVSFEVWQNLLYLETRLELFSDVIKHADEAIESFPNQGMLHYFNGFAQMRTRNYEEAVFSLDQAKKLSGSSNSLAGEINSMLGDSYNALKQYEKSDKAYDEALAINPNNDIVLNNYSYYLSLRKANLDKAEKMSAQLVKNNPDNPTFLDTHAWVLFVQEKYKEAKKIIERAISTGKANATHFEHYGDILFKLGDVEEAVTQWEKARGTNAHNETLNKKIANRQIYE